MTRLHPLPAILAISSAIVLGHAAWAQSTAPATRDTTTTDRSANLVREDAGFLKQAAENGHTEVEGSRLAETRATSTQVKEFARQMIADHTKANAELTKLAAGKGVELPTDPSMMQKGKLKLLGTSEGKEFDRKYAEELGVKAHEDTIKLFEKAASGAKDAEVKAWAAKTLPTLKQHLQHAQQLQTAVKN